MRQADDPIGERLRIGYLVKAAHDADAVGPRNPAQEFEHAGAGIRVEARHRLVGDNQFRLLSERTGDGDPLLLAARQAVRALRRMGQHPDPVEAFERQQAILPAKTPQPPAPGRDMTEPAREHVVERGEPAHQVELLLHDRDPPTRLAAECRDRVAADPGDAPVRRQEARDAAKEGRLADTARAENRDELMFSDREAHRLDRRAAVVGLGHILDNEAGPVRRRSRRADDMNCRRHSQTSWRRNQFDS